MEEEIIAPGGSGTLTEVLTEWVVDDSSSGLNILDIQSLTFTEADTNALFIEDVGDGRYKVEYCLPDSVNAVTIHAFFRTKGELIGIESTVGHVMVEQNENVIDAVANRHTATWFKKFREGQMRSGAEVLINIMDSYYGSEVPRSLTGLQVIALNEMYTSIPDAAQLRGSGEGVDVEGRTIFVETAPASVCFSPSVTAFRMFDANQLDENNCVTDLEDFFWAATATHSYGYVQTGLVIDARSLVEKDLTESVTMGICDGANATIDIEYDNTPLNLKTTLTQAEGTQVWEIYGNNKSQDTPCETTTVLLQVYGNTQQPIYEVSGTIDPPLVK